MECCAFRVGAKTWFSENLIPPATDMSNKTLERITELEKLIKHHQNLYYNAQPEISDKDFDELWDELKSLNPNSEIFSVVPKDASSGFEKTKHIIPMGSQEKAANPEAFRAWAAKMPFNRFIVQYKLDGASLELQYKDGIFIKAVTRGDGKIGDDITENAKLMSGFVKVLNNTSTGLKDTTPFTGGIRGEVIMKRSIHAEFFHNKANCRNAANGLMKKKDGAGCQHLQIICYDAVQGEPDKPFTGDAPFSNELEKIAWLKKTGLETVDFTVCKSVEEVIEYRSKIMQLRSSLDFDIDGLVIKNNEIDSEDVSRPRPEKQIAFKFELEQAETILHDIEWSESGVTYTPIALIEPVRLAGTTVKRASLVNPNTIETLNLKIGSKVIVTKRGEIIPKIEACIETPLNAQPVVYPQTCKTCNTELVNEGTRLFCANPNCPKLILHRIEKWINVLNIKDFGEKLIWNLFDAKRITSIYDLYTLTIKELSEIDRMGEISATKVFNSLHSKKEVTLSEFIAGFDIDGIGEVMMEKLEQAGFNNIHKLFSATENDFSNVYQFGEILSHTLVKNLAVLKPEMQRLLDSGFVKIKDKTTDNKKLPLTDFSFCFTGELSSMKRNEAEKKVKELGGITKSSVVKGLSYLVTNTPDSGSTKNKKAKELGTNIITEAEFLNIINGVFQIS